ncbi:chemotaxis protein CheA [Pseudogemmobacter faecipullorum]|uniref:Chemotaxis protein CheA n=1 Tax=Pseudogemmobacter faecipullorum TaxID=2755041 RepID=A0ABS8CLL6_9RHOB|nr:chemotaxis protein CheA [Pseudogemmobacter faecipullorum]MCB5410264.1 chemotaxis protein CheA [Pseudogemmobacter faecipullorum]
MSTLNAIRDTFFEEAEELLEALAEGLALMESQQADAETVNAVFRAVHSIKGGAGAFSLTALVGFAHRFETVLDALRCERIALSDEVIHVLLRSADHLADQVEAARQERGIEAGLTAGFLANLDLCLGDEAASLTAEADPEADFGFTALRLEIPDSLPELTITGAEAGVPGWQIRFQPWPQLFHNGHEPLHLLTGLSSLGRLQITPDLSARPGFDGYEAESLWLAWDISLSGPQSAAEIETAFDFVTGLCGLTILPAPPPGAAGADGAAAERAERAGPPLTATTDAASQPEETAEPSALPETLAAEGPLRRREPRPLPDDSDGRSPKPTLRVELERVDRLINAVGELIINQAMIEQSVLDLALPTDCEIITHTEDYRLLARDLQEAVMAIRAQPVKPLFQRMSRILREAAEATGKAARLISLGEATEVDKTVIERLADPLTHMIRNAVDHGLESPEDRIAAGKDPEGTIRLSAAHRSGSVLITLRDDGAGLNRARILEKAVARGLVASDAELSDAEIDNLLFLPGFSTAEKVSSLSGRGVGLDVVRNAVTALGGRIAITSWPGQGTEFMISLPLTLAVMDGMIISVSGQTMVIPIASVIETIRPTPADLHLIGTSDNLLAIRGRFLPMIDVARSLGFPERDLSQPPLVLLVETESQAQCALVVDAVHDQRQVVIKGLESNYGAIPGVSAATVLGDGQIALILDAEALTSHRLTQMPARNPASSGASHATH